ncbi:MAG TPA: host-nuclease inhibitor Gam family protein [Tepidisphaeraceae bacterium]|jgi:hypothetical protein|nr:host-nuclease inhibitor Gam family protein [Tepidisphaeraceae bacterium]
MCRIAHIPLFGDFFSPVSRNLRKGDRGLFFFGFAMLDAFDLLGLGLFDQLVHCFVNLGLKAACQQLCLDLRVGLDELEHGCGETPPKLSPVSIGNCAKLFFDGAMYGDIEFGFVHCHVRLLSLRQVKTQSGSCQESFLTYTGMRLTLSDVTMQADILDSRNAAELKTLAPDHFAVKDEASANWLVRKLIEAGAHIERVKEQSECEIRRTQRERDFLLMRFGPELERWARKELAKHKGRRKSLLLLSGTVGFRNLRAKIVVDDEPKLLAWAKRHCRKAIVVIERISKTIINDHLTATGELPNGAHVEPPREKFYVK